MSLKEHIQEGLETGQVIVLASLDKSAFDAAWWPSILHALKEFNCPRNLYNVITNYFSERQPNNRKRSNERISARLMLRAGTLECTI